MIKEALYASWAYLRKDQLTPEELAFLRRTLTVERKKNFSRGDPLPPTAVFVESERYFGVPRAYFDETYARQYEVTYAYPDHLSQPWLDRPIQFHGKLFPEQSEAVEALKSKCLPHRFFGGILWAAPGWGKSTTGCAFSAALRAKTLMVVHREFLLDQWSERIATYLPGAKVGRVQGKRCDYRDCHVVVGLVHSLANKRYSEDFYDYFDMVMVDEIHTTAGASTWGLVPSLFSAPWRVGLTATPRRKDAAENVFLYQVGPTFYRAKQARLPLQVRRVPTNFQAVLGEDVDRDKLIFHLCQDKARNQLIVDQMIRALEADRKLFVLSERIEHLQVLEVLLQGTLTAAGKQSVSTGFYIGGTDTDMRHLASKARVVFATYQLASVALDIPALDTLFMATPMSDVEQAVGRILRPHPEKKDPVAVDFIDRLVAACLRSAEARDAIYKRMEAPPPQLLDNSESESGDPS